jgi:hypothetical protein
MAILNNEEGNNTSSVYEHASKETNKQRLTRLLDEWKHSQEVKDVDELICRESKKGIGKEVLKVRSTFGTQVFPFG